MPPILGVSSYRKHLAWLLKQVPGRHLLGVEMGVARGELSHYLLHAEKRLTLLMVDQWGGYATDSPYYKTRDPMPRYDEATWQHMLNMTLDVAALFPGRGVVIKSNGEVAAERIREQYGMKCLDFIFIDADHSYEGVRADLGRWWPLMKPGGMFSGHEHGRYRFKGSTQAIDEFFASQSLKFGVGPGHVWSHQLETR